MAEFIPNAQSGVISNLVSTPSGTAVGKQTKTVTIEDFEGDLNAYSGDTGNFFLDTNQFQNGSQSLRASQSGSRITRDPKPSDPSPGDTWEFYTYPTSNYAGMYMLFGVQNDTDFYGVKFSPNNSFDIIIDSDENKLDSQGADSITNEWIRIEISWKEDGTISAIAEDSSNNEIGNISTNNTTYTSGGIGWFRRQSSGSDSHVDAAKFLNE
jgi:hypothetical protein